MTPTLPGRPASASYGRALRRAGPALRRCYTTLRDATQTWALQGELDPLQAKRRTVAVGWLGVPGVMPRVR